MGKTYVQGEILTAVDLNASLAESVNTSGTYTFTGSHTWGGTETFNGAVTLGSAAPLTSSSTISDKIGDVRKVPPTTVTSAPYTLIESDSGKVIVVNVSTAGTITIPANVFTSGDTINIFNQQNTPSKTISQGSGLTLVWTGQATTSTGNRTLGASGFCTIIYLSATSAIINGVGLT